ncbi:MAG: hypothetical protein JNK58_00325 [Phycisphaerae bacterium]|nr:hypothetical protein [Phycisphaerae bacterium]
MALKPAQIEAQLTALASAADRANRPASMLTFPAVLLVVALLYSAWSFRGLASSRSMATAMQNQGARVAGLIAEIKGRQKESIDLASIYPPAPFLGSQVGDETWKSPERGFREPPTVSQPTSARVDNASLISRSDVTVTVNNEEIEAIFRAADATLNHPYLKDRAFVSQAQLTPLGTGWRATFRFSVYEKK